MKKMNLHSLWTPHFRSSLVLTALTSMHFACSGVPAENSRSKVVAGYPAEATEHPVVALMKKDAEGIFYVFCSGVLVSQQHLLTAAHCSLQKDGNAHKPEDIRVFWGENDPEQRPEQALAVKTIQIHPEYDSNRMGSDVDGLIRPGKAADLAVWEIEVRPGQIVKTATIMAAGSITAFTGRDQTVLLLGFGKQNPWQSPWEAHTLNAAETPYQTVLNWSVRRREAVDGRLITKSVPISLPGSTDHEFYAGDRGKPDTCKGDSGGPLMVKNTNGQYLLVGLTSRGSSSCDVGGVATLVPAYAEWIKAEVKDLTFQTL